MSDTEVDTHREGLVHEFSFSELRRVFETATANVENVSFTITAVPTSPENLRPMLTIARAAGRGSGAALRRVELPRIAAQSFGKTFQDVAVGEAEGADVLRLFFARETGDLAAA